MVFAATLRLWTKDTDKALDVAIKRCVPWVERLKGMMIREFLASDLTVHDMMKRLGKKRPDQIYRMMFVINKREAKEGYFMDKLQRSLDFFIHVGVDKIDAGVHWKDICALCDRLDAGGTLTDGDLPIIEAALTQEKFRWPTEMAMSIYRMELERA